MLQFLFASMSARKEILTRTASLLLALCLGSLILNMARLPNKTKGRKCDVVHDDGSQNKAKRGGERKRKRGEREKDIKLNEKRNELKGKEWREAKCEPRQKKSLLQMTEINPSFSLYRRMNRYLTTIRLPLRFNRPWS